MSKAILKNKAIELRKDGYSYSYIKEKIGVSKSTLSIWLSSIPYRPNNHSKNKLISARQMSALAKRKILLESITLAKKTANEDIGILSERDMLMLGVGIYIGEGSKTNNIIRIANSDAKIIKFMVNWFNIACGVPMKNLRLRIHLYPDNNIQESEKYWSKVTGIPSDQFLKPSIDRRINKKNINRRKLPYGTAHLSLRSSGNKALGVSLARKICAWIDLVLV